MRAHTKCWLGRGCGLAQKAAHARLPFHGLSDFPKQHFVALAGVANVLLPFAWKPPEGLRDNRHHPFVAPPTALHGFVLNGSALTSSWFRGNRGRLPPWS